MRCWYTILKSLSSTDLGNIVKETKREFKLPFKWDIKGFFQNAEAHMLKNVYFFMCGHFLHKKFFTTIFTKLRAFLRKNIFLREK